MTALFRQGGHLVFSLDLSMSALSHQRTFRKVQAMSVIRPKADIDHDASKSALCELTQREQRFSQRAQKLEMPASAAGSAGESGGAHIAEREGSRPGLPMVW